jgi:asparagine synthase (glutamine-hydrolysing)
MFAFVLCDLKNMRVVLGRDHLGVKPLYYALLEGGGIGFASELKSLLRLPGVDRTIDRTGLAKYLSFLWIPDPGSPFRGIKKLAPGSYAVYDFGGFTKHTYWDVPINEEKAPPVSAVAAVDTLISESVKDRLVADVPIGVYLSGGVDSSLVTAIAAREVDGPLLTATVGFPSKDLAIDPLGSDLEYARLMRDQPGLDLDYRELLVEADAAATLRKLVWHCDDPVADPAIIPTYLIAEAIKSTATVMLSGVGAEETFAGYPRYAAGLLAGRLDHIPRRLRTLISALGCRIPLPTGGVAFRRVRRSRKFLQALTLEGLDRYLSYRTYFSPQEVSRLLGARFDGAEIAEEHSVYWDAAKNAPPLDRMLYLDLKTYLPCLNLAYVDRASMAASVEVREPLLDVRLVELVFSLPASSKIRGWRQKAVLKDVAAKYLPKAIVERRKVGFGSPVKAWLRGPLRGLVTRTLARDSVRQYGVLDGTEVATVLEDTNHEDWALRVWSLLYLQLWAETFLDSERLGRASPGYNGDVRLSHPDRR